jgi:hypothetical protein
MMSIRVPVEDFRRDGFVIVRNVFSTEEISRLRSVVGGLRDKAVAGEDFDRSNIASRLVLLRGDLLSMDDLKTMDYVAFDERVVNTARQLLGRPEVVVYHGDSSAQTGEGERGFHKDNCDRTNPTGPDWSGEYGVIRMALYLQDHTVSSGGLKTRRRSHRYFSRHRGRAVNLGTSAGDLVFWYLTTSHSGNFVRIRGVPNVVLHPRLERIVPRWLRVPEHAERMSIFCSFGAPSPHLDRYIEYQSKRPDMQKHWTRAGMGPHLDRLAAQRGIELRRPWLRPSGAGKLERLDVRPTTRRAG